MTCALSPPLRRAALPAVVALALCAVFGARARVGASGPGAFDVLRPGREIASLRPDGLPPRHPDEAWRLAPDGRSLLRLQGLPWPRVVRHRLEEGDFGPPRPVAPLVPLLSAAPRFGADGEEVLLTAVGGPDLVASDLGPPAAWRVRPGDGRPERWRPPSGAPADAFAVLLDVAPEGDVVLVGEGRTGERGSPPLRERLRGGGLRFVPALLPLGPGPAGEAKDGEPRRLGARRWTLASRPRFSADGARVLALRFDAGLSAGEVVAAPTAGGPWAPTGDPPGTLPRDGGDVEIVSRAVIHRGSFGRNPFRRHELLRPGSTRAVFRPPPSAKGLAVPLAVRAGRILWREGDRDRPRVVLSQLVEEPGGAGEGAGGHPFARDAEAVVSCRILARAPPEAAALLRAVRDGLRGEAPALPRALRARWIQLDPAGAAPPTRVEVVEAADGRIAITRTTALGEEDAIEARQTVAFDGRACRLRGPRGRVRRVEAGWVAPEIDALSPYRQLLDPAGMAEPRLRFSAPRRLRDGEDRAARALRFAYEDGHRGELVLEESPGGWRPRRWESPLVFADAASRAAAGDAPPERVVAYAEWHPVDGLGRIPHEIRCRGYGGFVLRLEEIEPLPEAPSAEAFLSGTGDAPR